MKRMITKQEIEKIVRESMRKKLKEEYLDQEERMEDIKNLRSVLYNTNLTLKNVANMLKQYITSKSQLPENFSIIKSVAEMEQAFRHIKEIVNHLKNLK